MSRCGDRIESTKVTKGGQMYRSPRSWLFVIIITATALLAGANPARAGFTLDLEVRETYEDNVIGLTADNPNIISTTAAAAAGGAVGEVAAGDKKGSGGGGGPKALHMRKGELNDIPTTVASTPSTTTAAAGAGGTGGQTQTVTAGDFSTNIGVDAGYAHD